MHHSRQPRHVRSVVHRHSPDTVLVGDVQLIITVAGYNVVGVLHSFNVNTFTERTQCFGLVHLDDGGLLKDNVHGVT